MSRRHEPFTPDQLELLAACVELAGMVGLHRYQRDGADRTVTHDQLADLLGAVELRRWQAGPPPVA